jgi:5-formyltetrahydrofolate cyclo-ligase
VETAADPGPGEAKRRLRLRLLAARANRPDPERAAAATALRDRVLALPEVRDAAIATCYASMPDEPGTAPLLDGLSALGCTILLPVLHPDFDLGWAEYEAGALRPARFGIGEPAGAPLGADVLSTVDVMVCPALAVDPSGRRLGRGGGSFDRALRRAPSAVLRVALVYDDEVLADVPTDRHDEPVHVVVTPTRTIRICGA